MSISLLVWGACPPEHGAAVQHGMIDMAAQRLKGALCGGTCDIGGGWILAVAVGVSPVDPISLRDEAIVPPLFAVQARFEAQCPDPPRPIPSGPASAGPCQ